VVDTTTTNGTGTYTLDDPVSPGAGLRTVADAVANGDLANADTVYYYVVDTNTQGAGLKWEHGIGTIGSSGATLARTTIIESSNGDAAVSWGIGGSRTVRIGVGVSGLALLAGAQTFTALQTLSAGFVAEANSRMKLSAASVGALDVGSMTSAINTTIGRYGFIGHSSTGVERVAAQWQAILTDNTNASEDALIRAVVMVNGVNAVVAQIDSGGVMDGSGARYALQGVLNAPSGTNLYFPLQSTVPTGWTKNTSHNDAALRVVSGTVAPTGGSRGLSSSTVGAWTLGILEIPPHTHGPGAGNSFHMRNTGSGDSYATSPGNLFTSAAATAVAGGGGPHDHALALKYVDGVFGTKT
jgi:hypothetical protein